MSAAKKALRRREVFIDSSYLASSSTLVYEGDQLEWRPRSVAGSFTFDPTIAEQLPVIYEVLSKSVPCLPLTLRA